WLRLLVRSPVASAPPSPGALRRALCAPVPGGALPPRGSGAWLLTRLVPVVGSAGRVGCAPPALGLPPAPRWLAPGRARPGAAALAGAPPVKPAVWEGVCADSCAPAGATPGPVGAAGLAPAGVTCCWLAGMCSPAA